MIPEWRLVKEWHVNGVPHRELVNQRTGQRCVAVDEEMLRKAREPKPHAPKKLDPFGRHHRRRQ